MTYYASWPFLALEIADEAARIYDVVRSANAPNFRGAREYICTDLDMPQWKVRATFHGDDHWIMDCIHWDKDNGDVRVGRWTRLSCALDCLNPTEKAVA